MNELSTPTPRSLDSRCFRAIIHVSMPFFAWAAYRAARMTLSDACVVKRTHKRR